MAEKPKRPQIRKMRLFTRGKNPDLDALHIACTVLEECEPKMRLANLNFIADRFGYRLWRK